MHAHLVTSIFQRHYKSTNHGFNWLTLPYLMNRRCRRIPSAIIELLEDRLENSSDQLQPLKDHNILKTQQNIWVTAQGTEQGIVSIMQNKIQQNRVTTGLIQVEKKA